VLQKALSSKDKEISDQRNLLKVLADTLSVRHLELRKENFKEGFEVLKEKIVKDLSYRQLPIWHSGLTVSLRWTSNSGEYLKTMAEENVGALTQPLPGWREESPVIRLLFKTNEELEKLLPSRLRKEYPGDSYAILEAPFELSWSSRTKKLSAHFKYQVYLRSGSKSMMIRTDKRWHVPKHLKVKIP